MAERNTGSDRAQRQDRSPDAAQRGQDSRTSGLDAERVAQRAYERFRERGGEHGHDQEDWFAAEQELKSGSERAPDQVAGDVDARRLEESARNVGRTSRTK